MIETFKRNLANVRDRIETAAMRSGRAAEQIQLIGVTKYVDAQVTRAFVEAGAHVLGESRPQQLWEKAEQLADLEIEWHLIGHLQRNKVKKTLPFVKLIHSVDSDRLLKSINAASQEAGLTTRVLLEVNVSGESAKHGYSDDQLKQTVDQMERYPAVEVQGLMAMAGLQGSLDDARREFIHLRELRDSLASQSLPENVSLRELSMGMSGDFEVAIEEGSTMVRVGSALFEGV